MRFTDYAGIGLIETVMILTLTITEIPTGAVADLLGKKPTLILAFFLEAVGTFIMAVTPNFQILLLSIVIMCIGGTFYSGTIDALIYDSLKEDGEEGNYDKKISNISMISLIAPAVCGVIGGFLYKISPSLPYFANAFGYSLGMILSFFLIEPKIDSIKFSFKNYLSQTIQGLKELVKSTEVKKQTILLLSIGFFVVIANEMLDYFLGAEFGFSEIQLGILWGVIYIISAVATQATPYLRKIFKNNLSIILTGVVMAVTFIISPFLGLVLGGISLGIRASLESVFGNLASITINQNTESKFRATTLSTFNMIKNIPYVLSAYFIGSISDKLSAKTTAMYLGILLLVFIVVQLFLSQKKKEERIIIH